MMQIAAKKFRELEKSMKRDRPAAVAEARALAQNVLDPAQATVEQVWAALWDKPLYANSHVKAGEGYVKKLRPLVEDLGWQSWGIPDQPYVEFSGGKANLETSFRFTNHAPSGLSDIKISRKRLYAIGGAARALNKWSCASETPVAGFLGKNSGDLLDQVQNDLGLRWGHITVMHFLTELGLSCKPDRWLVRSVHALGIANGFNPERKAPNRREAILIDRAVKQLVAQLYGTSSGPPLRYVDKILMEASRLEFLGKGSSTPKRPRCKPSRC